MARGPGGQEDEVREICLQTITPLCDETWVDAAGNVIGLIKGKRKANESHVDGVGELNWFDPDGRAVGDLTELLVQLREYMVTNNLTAGAGAWTGCEINLSVDEMKFGIEFSYNK